jgi:hypothetical protein
VTILDEQIQEFLNKKSPGKENWLEIDDFLSFAKNCDNDDVLIYFSWIIDTQYKDYHTIIGVLVKDDKLSNLPDTNRMMVPGSAWTVCGLQCEGEVFSCEEEYGYESLFFIRDDFAARTENEKELNLNVEIYQKITHLLNLHYVPHKNAYCAYNNLGELVEVIRICISKEKKYKYITIKRKYLDNYLHITKKTLVKYLNCWRFFPNLENLGWEKQSIKIIDDDGIKGELTTADGKIHMEGYRIYPKIIPSTPSSIGLEGEKKYETFNIYDWRHQKNTECSCSPKNSCDYFNMKENDLPHKVSAAYFKEEVLSKYRNNPDKYKVSIHERRIRCKNGGWSLRLGVNEGLVFVYLYEIALLPYEEQLYWKSLNVVPPKINNRFGVPEEYAKTDFEGKFREPNSWDIYYKVFEKIKERDDIWTIEPDSKVEPTIDENSKTWADKIGNLYNIFLDDNHVKLDVLREKLKSLTGKEIDKTSRSVALFHIIISAKKLPTDKLNVLKEIRAIRNGCSAHQSQTYLKKQTGKAKENFGSLKKHYEDLIARLTDCLSFLLDNIQ